MTAPEPWIVDHPVKATALLAVFVLCGDLGVPQLARSLGWESSLASNTGITMSIGGAVLGIIMWGAVVRRIDRRRAR